MQTHTTRSPLLTPREVAEMLNVRPRTLEDWRCRKPGTLPFVRLGRAIRYRREDVERMVTNGVVGGEQ